MTLAATRPLYHEDPAQLTFAATVLDVQAHEIALDATAFYPEEVVRTPTSGSCAGQAQRRAWLRPARTRPPG
ncbi:hypothetical protein ACFSC4_05130 [Deinococcus malanensis]|uniref:hypothetical protein n=1 Tax=Deinococcus malanensis TaxID=1706855 RepID=UPI0036446600